MRLAFASGALLISLAFGVWLHVAELRALSLAGQWLLSPNEDQGLPALPWGGHAADDLRRSLTAGWTALGPEHAERRLFELARFYPLDAAVWTELARVEASRMQPRQQEFDARLNTALAAEPNSRRVLWRAAQVAMQAGRLDLAGELLRDSVAGSPGEVRLALAMAGRWLQDPEELVGRIVPTSPQHHDFAMRHALNQRDMALAEAVWQRAGSSATIEDRILLDFVDALMRTGAIDRAAAIWAEHDSDFAEFGVPNARFTRQMDAERGMGWRIRQPEGVRIRRDLEVFHTAPASLQIAFSGQHNINLASPSVEIPVTAGGRYRLSGYWRGQGLTTRARPYLWLRSDHGGLRAEQAVPGGQFDWTAWTFEFVAPPEAGLVRLVLRRDETVAFDRNIGGQLWLDSLVLEPLTVRSGHDGNSEGP